MVVALGGEVSFKCTARRYTPQSSHPASSFRTSATATERTRRACGTSVIVSPPRSARRRRSTQQEAWHHTRPSTTRPADHLILRIRVHPAAALPRVLYAPCPAPCRRVYSCALGTRNLAPPRSAVFSRSAHHMKGHAFLKLCPPRRGRDASIGPVTCYISPRGGHVHHHQSPL